MKKGFLTILIPFFFLISFGFVTTVTSQEYLEKRSFTDIGKKAIPAVVFIKAQCGGLDGASEDCENPFDSFSDELYRRFFGHPGQGGHRQPQQQQMLPRGSGFIVSADGYILTNSHVIKNASKILVIINSGEEYTAKFIGADPRTDLAVIKIEGKNLPFIPFGNSDELEIGEWVAAIGSPFELQATLTQGIVSAKGRQNLRIADLEDFIQTDAAINPGNSGGPLLNLKGEVIGINTAIVSQSGGYMGIGFAIPSNMAKYVVDQIIHTGSVKRGYLGFFLQEITKEMSEAMNLEKSEGALVAEVIKGSPAEKSGIKQGDVIVEYNNTPIKNMIAFRKEISIMNPGTILKLKIFRNGKYETTSVTLQASPDESVVSNPSLQLGIEVSELKKVNPEILQKFPYSPDTEGVIITSVARGSLGERSGLKPGMLILQVNQSKIKTPSDFYAALKESENKKHILLLLRFQNMTQFMTIRTK